jgi:hypothetical protein
MKYDIIGDIHGHVNDLKELLKKMGYGLSERGHYYHSDRQAVFVGDYIDRGKNSREVVQIVRAMQENRSAIALMGNHEYNALCFHTKGSGGEYLRPRTNQNIKQHCATLHSFENDGFLNETLEWIKQLPLFWEDDHLRVVHACWDPEQLEVLRQNFGGNTLKMDLLETSTKEGNPLFEAIEIVLKGKELDLPEGITFLDKDKHPRKEIRVKWWEDSFGKSYQELAVKSEDVKNLSSAHKVEHVSNTSSYPSDEKPVFFGHYWLEDKQPKLQASNVCCVDYSIAKEGILVAYRFDGEKELNEKKFTWLY